MDAIVMLREDHKAVEKLFKELERGDLEVVPQICQMLTQHAALEEQHFYPMVRRELSDEKDDVLEAVEEHHVMKVLIGELEGLDPSEESYKAKATVLMENVRHHVKEEEDEMFPAVRSTLGRKRLVEIGDEMEQAKGALAR